jgi:hypothetical protein
MQYHHIPKKKQRKENIGKKKKTQGILDVKRDREH